MELDELKDSWNNISEQLSGQQQISPQLIDQVTKDKFNSRLNKIIYPELAGVMICFAGAAYLVFRFGKLDTIFMQAVGILAILLLLLLSVIGLISIRRLRLATDITKPYAETCKDFATQKMQFYKWQQVNMLLACLLLVLVILLFSKLFSGKDLAGNKYFWTLSFSLGYLFLLFYSRWVARSYRNTIRQAEDLLKDLVS